jgi:LacI family transcriptional regulator
MTWVSLGRRVDGDPQQAFGGAVAMSLHSGSSRATLRDVAALAGVSIKTVSRVVNGEPGVGPAKVRAVQQAVAQLDYRPNHSASSLRRADRRTSAVGAVLEDLANPYSAEVLRALEDSARARDVLVFAGSVDGDPERERELVRAFSSRRADALVLVPVTEQQGYLEREVEVGTPVVFIDRPPTGFGADCVITDNIEGAVHAVHHLAAHGHRRIAFLGDARGLPTARDRFTGYLQAMASLGLPVTDDLVAHDLMTGDVTQRAVDGLLTSEHPPTALFTARNDITIAAVRSLQRHGEERQTALVGFDDFPLADLVRPGVTVMAQDPTAIGRRAAELVFARLEGDTSPPHTAVVRTRLVERGSGEIPPPTLGSTGASTDGG